MYQRGTTYYFNRRVPKDVQEYYKSSRIVICLKTSRKDRAVRAGMSIAQRLEDYWLSLRLSKLDVPGLHLLRDKPVSTGSLTTQCCLIALTESYSVSNGHMCENCLLYTSPSPRDS